MSTNLPLEDSAAAAPVSSIAPRDPGRRRRSRGLAEFKRSLTYLRPYWKMVLTSIVCALFVGITTTAGLGAMLPIMRVLINGDRVQTWVYRQTAARRLGAYLVDDPEKVQVLSLRKLSSPAGDARWTGGEVLVEPGQTPPASLPDATAAKTTIGRPAEGTGHDRRARCGRARERPAGNAHASRGPDLSPLVHAPWRSICPSNRSGRSRRSSACW